jgi:multiple sugar transport system permease protein
MELEMAQRQKLSSPERRAKQQRLLLRSVIYHAVVLGFSYVMIYPVLWLFASSFKGPAEIWTDIGSLIPRGFTFENYIKGWSGFGGITFSTFYLNSFIYAGVGTLAVVLSSAIVAYGFSRIRFFGRSFWFTCMLMTLMLPIQAQIIPQYIMFSKLDMINTFYPLLLPKFCGHAFFIFMIMQFIRGIPRELDEAAKIDGCNQLGIFLQVILPLTLPALITSAIFSFYWSWEDFLLPLVYLTEPKLYTISLALRSFADPSATTPWGEIFAMSALSLVPVFVLFIAFQRYLTQGIATTGLKG